MNYYEPFLEYARESLPGLPLWNPYTGTAMTFGILAFALTAVLIMVKRGA